MVNSKLVMSNWSNLGLGIVGIAGFSFASFHAKNPLKFYVRDYDIVSLWSHLNNSMIRKRERNLGENMINLYREV